MYVCMYVCRYVESSYVRTHVRTYVHVCRYKGVCVCWYFMPRVWCLVNVSFRVCVKTNISLGTFIN